jgi:hypothetical protein
MWMIFGREKKRRLSARSPDASRGFLVLGRSFVVSKFALRFAFTPGYFAHRHQ